MDTNSSPAALDVLPHVLTDWAGENRAVVVLTASGTRYRFDLTLGTVRRMRSGTTGSPSFELRRDEEEIRVLCLEPVAIGSPMTMLLALRDDGVPTLRTTNEVISVTPVDTLETLALG